MSITLSAVRTRRHRFTLGPVDVELTPGRIALLGLNGAGKSTLIQTLTGLLPHEGVIAVDGVACRHLPPRQTGLVPQSPTAAPFISARDAVLASAHLKDVSPQTCGPATDEALDRVGLADLAQTRASRLSGGQARRLAIAQAIVHRPSFLLMDEPTAGLDPLQRQGIRRILDEQPEGTTTIVTTHILEDVAEWADRVLVLSAGSLADDLDLRAVPAGQRLGHLEERVAGLGGEGR